MSIIRLVITVSIKIKEIITKTKYSTELKKYGKKIKNNKFLTPLAAAIGFFFLFFTAI